MSAEAHSVGKFVACTTHRRSILFVQAAFGLVGCSL